MTNSDHEHSGGAPVMTNGAKAYQYDVFISYRRRAPASDWVANHFHPLLEQWLSEHLPRPVSIFRDPQIDTGSRWPAQLAQALQRSRCLVAIWSPPYFQPHWCMAEWSSMEERERRLGYFSNENPSGLAWPIVFADGVHFPASVKTRQYRDFHLWNHPSLVLQHTTKYVDFVDEIQRFAEDLASALAAAPAWQDDFPVLFPDELQPEPRMQVPRIG